MIAIPFLYFPAGVVPAGTRIALPEKFPEVADILACVRHRLTAATTFENTVFEVVDTAPSGAQIQLVGPKSFVLGDDTAAGDIYEVFFLVDHRFWAARM